MNAHLILLIGLPGSGKSSLAQQLAIEYRNCHIISVDALRAKLKGKSSQDSGQQLWIEIEQQLQQAIQRCQEQPGAVIYDATNVTFGTRRRAIRLARTAGFTQITGIWVDTPLELCLNRNRQRPQIIPRLSILLMYCQLLVTLPSPQEDLEQLIRHSYSNCSDDISLLIQRLKA